MHVVDLNHVDAVLSHRLRQRVEVDLLLSLGAIQQIVDSDVRPSATHARAKKHKHLCSNSRAINKFTSRGYRCVWKPLRMRARTHLQWTMVLPGCESSNERTLRRKAMIGAARVGTP